MYNLFLFLDGKSSVRFIIERIITPLCAYGILSKTIALEFGTMSHPLDDLPGHRFGQVTSFAGHDTRLEPFAEDYCDEGIVGQTN